MWHVVGISLAFVLGGVIGMVASVHQEALPHIPLFTAMDCYVENRDREPWEVYPDGQVLQVGVRKYLAVNRDQRITQDRYSGYKVYGFEMEMDAFERTYKPVMCPATWVK